MMEKGFKRSLEEYLDDNFKERYVNKIKNGTKFEIVKKSEREDKEILIFARKEHVDIIVMGTHGKTGIEHVFFRSVAEKVLRHSPFPVFIIPCKKSLERS